MCMISHNWTVCAKYLDGDPAGFELCSGANEGLHQYASENGRALTHIVAKPGRHTWADSV